MMYKQIIELSNIYFKNDFYVKHQEHTDNKLGPLYQGENHLR